MICQNCRHQNDPEAKYCLKCGTKLEQQNPNSEGGSVDKYFSNKRELYLDQAKKLANKEMILGIVWLGAGALITFGGYLFTPAGGTYYVLWGAMIVGGYRFIRGIGYKLNPESLLDKAERIAKKGNTK